MLQSQAIRAIARNGTGWKIAVPRQVLEQLNWKLGSEILFQINPDDTVTLKELQLPLLPANPIRRPG